MTAKGSFQKENQLRRREAEECLPRFLENASMGQPPPTNPGHWTYSLGQSVE